MILKLEMIAKTLRCCWYQSQSCCTLHERVIHNLMVYSVKVSNRASKLVTLRIIRKYYYTLSRKTTFQSPNPKGGKEIVGGLETNLAERGR